LWWQFYFYQNNNFKHTMNNAGYEQDSNEETTVVLAAARALLGLCPPPSPPPAFEVPQRQRHVFRSLASDVSSTSVPATSGTITARNFSPGTLVSCDASSIGDSDVSDLVSVETPRRVLYENATSTGGEIPHEGIMQGQSISLSLPQDGENLSPLHAFMRRYCVEAFAATEEDLVTPRYGKAHSGRITLGQVGIRCLHCKYRPVCDRPERAVCFPSSLKNIYHSIETWQRRHSLVCNDIPTWVKHNMTELVQRSRAGSGGRRQYWEESARLLGMETTAYGVRFVRKPGYMRPEHTAAAPAYVQVVDAKKRSFSNSIVQKEDQDLVTKYLYMLLDQMEACQFIEQDRSGGRSKVKDCPVGFPGMQCKHCGGKCGVGRYFPTSLSALASANSDRNIFNHLAKCRKCPGDIRNRLQSLRNQQTSLKNRRGQRKEFFERVWTRLHPPQAT
jgi:hypothetical protein